MQKLMGILIVAGIACGAAQAQTATTPEKKVTTGKAATGKHAEKHAAKPAAEKPGALLDDDDKEYDGTGTAVTEIQCELGNKVTLYRNAGDEDHLALRWSKRVHRMTRVSTTTGANRFENAKFGLVWIGIPAKGMLLDARHGHQLANECKDAEQMMATPAEPTKPADVPGPIPAPRADKTKKH